jgi:putative transposase
MVVEFKGSHFEREIILRGVRWYVVYPISYRQLEEMMEERSVEVDCRVAAIEGLAHIW